MEVKGVYMKMRGSQDRAGHKAALGAESREHVPCTHRDSLSCFSLKWQRRVQLVS